MLTKIPIRRAMRSARSLELPPTFRLVTLREAGDAFAHAAVIAAEAGAGTLVQVGRFDTPEFAVVHEPEQSPRLARSALYIGLCALGDALAVRAERRFLLDALAGPSPARSCCQKSPWGNPDPAPPSSRLEHRS
jgi:hypothetical protein